MITASSTSTFSITTINGETVLDSYHQTDREAEKRQQKLHLLSGVTALSHATCTSSNTWNQPTLIGSPTASNELEARQLPSTPIWESLTNLLKTTICDH